MKHTKINSIFVSLKDVKGPENHAHCPDCARHQCQGLVGWVYMNDPADPGLHNPMSSLLFFFGSFLNWYKVEYIRSMNLHRLYNHKLYK